MNHCANPTRYNVEQTGRKIYDYQIYGINSLLKIVTFRRNDRSKEK